GLFPDQFEESLDGGVVKFGGGPAPMGLGLDGPGRAASLQKADEEGQADGEQVGQLAERVLAAVNRGDEVFSEIVGVRNHGGTSFLAAPPSYSSLYATRVR